MNQDEIISMAKEARIYRDDSWRFEMLSERNALEAFASLVAAAEREACAKVCETLGVHPALNVYAGGPDWYKHGKECAAEIRARGETKNG
jgi:hypothetical protein